MVLYGTENLSNDKQAYELLALAAKKHWNWSALPEIQREDGGKPFFPNFQDYHFNLSHSGSLALCGLDHSPVGVDIQIIKKWHPRLPARVCCSAELDWLEQQPDPEMAFATLWALKESRVKQSGKGLRSQIRAIHVPLPQHWDTPVKLDNLWFRVYLGEHWAAAVCTLTPPPAEILWKSLNLSSSP